MHEESSPNLVTTARETARHRIIEGLRTQILTGQYAPGTQLPSTKELAVTWQASPFTIHNALRALTKEGWIDRRHGAGTFISDPKTRFLTAGIYYDTDIGSDRVNAFTRNIHFSVLAQLEYLKKKSMVFMDTRPELEQTQVFPELADAITHRRIQCLIVPRGNFTNSPSLAHLPLPTVFASNPFSTNIAHFDPEQLLLESVARLREQGCHTVGFVSNVWTAPHDRNTFRDYYRHFQNAVAAVGVTTKPEWMCEPPTWTADLENYGYVQFKKLAALDEKPDGIIVYADGVARGVILAVLELGLQAAPMKMKFVLHRNAHLPYFCPFPVTWAISDEGALAQGLIQLLQKQFSGEKISPVLIPYLFKTSDELQRTPSL